MKTQLYRAEADTPFGAYIIVVESTQQDAKADMRAALKAEFHVHSAQVIIEEEISKTNRRVLRKMHPIKKCFSYSSNRQWAWLKKLDM